jgi:hypothetical protein
MFTFTCHFKIKRQWLINGIRLEGLTSLQKNLSLVVCSAKERDRTIEIDMQWPKLKYKGKYSKP